MNSHGVDLDSTLATVGDGPYRPGVVGEPIPLMVERVKRWLAQGDRVDIFTARVHPSHGVEEVEMATRAVKKWFKDLFGMEPIITCQKDPRWEDFWDDKAIQVIPGTGKRADGIVDVELEEPDGMGEYLS